MATRRQINESELWTLATIMAANGNVPRNVGGWRYAGDGHNVHGPLGMAGSLGQISEYMGRRYVCVTAFPSDPRFHLSNNHPDYLSGRSAEWVIIPRPDECDWDYIPREYHRPVTECRIREAACV